MYSHSFYFLFTPINYLIHSFYILFYFFIFQFLGILDDHFNTQLYSYYHDEMMVGLKDSFKLLDEHKKSVELQSARLMATLEPIYK
jgi:hypothetical protein